MLLPFKLERREAGIGAAMDVMGDAGDVVRILQMAIEKGR